MLILSEDQPASAIIGAAETERWTAGPEAGRRARHGPYLGRREPCSGARGQGQGLEKIIISHGRWAITGLSVGDLKEFAVLGCFVEFEFCLMMPIMNFAQG